jgi:hypothetical protein
MVSETLPFTFTCHRRVKPLHVPVEMASELPDSTFWRQNFTYFRFDSERGAHSAPALRRPVFVSIYNPLCCYVKYTVALFYHLALLAREC